MRILVHFQRLLHVTERGRGMPIEGPAIVMTLNHFGPRLLIRTKFSHRRLF